ncbi:MAG: hypothetical protein ACQR33_06655 [Candidatus Saccharibacteria bacterium]
MSLAYENLYFAEGEEALGSGALELEPVATETTIPRLGLPLGSMVELMDAYDNHLPGMDGVEQVNATPSFRKAGSSGS